MLHERSGAIGKCREKKWNGIGKMKEEPIDILTYFILQSIGSH